MSAGIFNLPRGAMLALGAAVAVLLGWRVVVVGIDALESRRSTSPAQPRAGVPQKATQASPAAKPAESEATLRQRLAGDPTDAASLMRLALDLERQGKRDDAAAAIREVLRLAGGDPRLLLQAATFFQRNGDEAQAFATLRLAVDASKGQVKANAWEIFTAALDTGQHRDLFDDIARADPPWWPTFFQAACGRSKNIDALQVLLAARVKAGVDTAADRRCVIDRLQRDGQWTSAYLLWLNGLPLEQRQRVGYVFNGGFELPLTRLGFDWVAPAQEGVTVSVETAEGMTGQRALAVAFTGKRPGAPPVQQYLLLAPGRYRFEGRGRTALEAALGLQWGLYCHDPRVRAPRQLAVTDRFIGAAGWRDFRHEFDVPGDCPVQLLRLEPAASRSDGSKPDAVAARLKGRLWFDDLRVGFLD